jgi:hypothetical protein
MPCALPDGPAIEKFGQGVAPANRSALQESGAVQMTLAISGLNGSGSSESADLSQYLASRLVPLTGTLGWILYRMTWKALATPSGRLIYRLQARARRTSATGFTSWPTPKVARGDYQYSNGDHNKKVLNLAGAVKLATWPTPRAEKNTPQEREDFTPGLAQVASWATPTVDSAHPRKKNYTQGGTPLTLQAAGAAKNSRPLNEQAVSGLTASGSTAQTGSIGQLNPAFPLWLMGIPQEWLNCAP